MILYMIRSNGTAIGLELEISAFMYYVLLNKYCAYGNEWRQFDVAIVFSDGKNKGKPQKNECKK